MISNIPFYEILSAAVTRRRYPTYSSYEAGNHLHDPEEKEEPCATCRMALCVCGREPEGQDE